MIMYGLDREEAAEVIGQYTVPQICSKLGIPYMTPGEISLSDFDYNHAAYQYKMDKLLQGKELSEDITTYEDTHKLFAFARSFGLAESDDVVYFVPFIFDGGDSDHAYIAVLVNKRMTFTTYWVRE